MTEGAYKHLRLLGLTRAGVHRAATDLEAAGA